jgi:hypothetical protein
LKIAICMVVRNEEAGILEWIAFHAIAGFNSFLIFDDHSTDATVERASLASRHLDVRVLPWGDLQAAHQAAGYEKICRRFAGEFDWIAFFDADEFLVPWPCSTIAELLAAQAGHASVVVPWRVFGSSGHIEKPPGLIIENFTRRAGPGFAPNRHVKSIVRPARVTGAVNAHYFTVDGTHALPDGTTPAWEKLGILQTYPTELNWYVHHYFTRSKEHWAERMRRGQISGYVRSPKEFYDYDRNEVPDDHAASYAPAVKILLRQALRYDHVLIACARWETQYIAEWLSYHRLLGFDHVYLYCNDDDPAELRQAVLPFILGPKPFVTFLHYKEIGAQQDMYLHYLRNYKDLTAWMCFLDIDEFIRLPNHGTIGQFIATFPRDTDSIYFNWCFFGNNGFAERPPGQVLLKYTRRAGHLYNHMTKHITRAAAIDVNRIRLGVMSDFWHYWDSLESFRDLKIVNVLGQDMHEYYDTGGALIAALRQDGVFETLVAAGIINHYAFKSKQDFLIRFERGVDGVFAQQVDYRKAFYDGRAEMILTRLDEVDDVHLASLWRRQLEQAQTDCNRPSALELFPEFHPPASLPARVPASASASASASAPAPTQAVPRAAPLRNLAPGKAATQSSICRWSRGHTPAQDAQAAVTGIATGKRSFHTALELMPWWQIDLGQPCVISQIKILNTAEADVSARFTHFKISIINEAGVWVDVCVKEDDAPVGGAGTPFIWQPNYAAGGRFVRITLLGFGYLHLDQVEIFATPNGAATVIPPVSDQSLFASFISLGDNCEFGLVQRAAGIEPLDLLRFASTGRDETGLIMALRERFAAFATAAELGVTDDGGEWITRCPRYTMTFHTNRYARDTDLATVVNDETKRLSFLARKTVDDLTNSGKIFLRKSNRPVTDSTMIEMYKAMQDYGAPVLLWVTLTDEEHPHTTVRRLAPGLLRGYIKRFAPYELAKDIRIEDWRDLCRAANGDLKLQ